MSILADISESLAMMKKYLLAICCILGLGCLYAQLPPLPEMFVGPRFNSFSIGEQDERYESKLQKRPSIGLAGGVHFPVPNKYKLPIYMGFEANILRQNIYHVFTDENLVRTTDFNLQQLNLVIPVKLYFLNRDKDPLKIYVQGGLSLKLLNYGSGFTETVTQIETQPSVFEAETQRENLNGRVDAFRLMSIPVEGGISFYPWKGLYGFGISGGMFLTELTTGPSGLGYTGAWVSATFNARLIRRDAYGF